MPGRLVRFRADPRKIRVSIRHLGEADEHEDGIDLGMGWTYHHPWLD